MRNIAFVICLIAVCATMTACPGSKNPGDKFKEALNLSQTAHSDLLLVESKLGEIMLNGVSQPAGSCKTAAGLAPVEAKIADLRKQLDALKPADMPMETKTIQTGIDPNTQQPQFEKTTTIDWGKVTGDDQKIWANLNNAESGLSIALKTAEVACQCAESGDRESMFCQIIEVQKVGGRIALDLDTVQKAYLLPAKEIIEKPPVK